MSKAIKIKELSKYINSLVKRDPILANLHVEGEVSNFKISSGNVYFVLKDESAALRCIIFKNMTLAKTISIKDGMKVVARGSLTTYDYGSYYQLLVKEIVSDGVGDIYQQFEILKEKLLKEGLFDTDKKKDIPSMPKSIGVITSPTGAAIKDIINTIKRRFPISDIYIYPSKVQGTDAAKNLIDGLRYFDSSNMVDTIIIGRGGGSFEDLNSFNDESLLYEIFKTKTPVISAVGHEVDSMLSDFVADLRAATPTAAAELATPRIEDLKKDLNDKVERIRKNYDNFFLEEKKILDYYLKELNYYNPKEKIFNLRKELNSSFSRLQELSKGYYIKEKYSLENFRLKLKNFNPLSIILKEKEELKILKRVLILNGSNFLIKEKNEISRLEEKLKRYDSRRILEKGYTLIYTNGKPIKNIDGLKIDEEVEIKFVDGYANAKITDKEKYIE